VRVVRDESVTGELTQTDAGGVEGTIRLAGGPSAARGVIHVSLTANGRGQVTGHPNGAAVDLRFRF
jgi:hypothetical protein